MILVARFWTDSSSCIKLAVLNTDGPQTGQAFLPLDQEAFSKKAIMAFGSSIKWYCFYFTKSFALDVGDRSKFVKTGRV